MSVEVCHRAWSYSACRWIWVSVLVVLAGTAAPTLELTPRRPTQSNEGEKKSTPQNITRSYLCPFNTTTQTGSDLCEQMRLETTPVALDFIDPKIETSNHSTEDVDSALSCSTTVRVLPARIHGCPDGFRCQIYESGDPVTGTPNKGMCISGLLTESDGESDDGSIDGHSGAAAFRERSAVYLPGGCVLTSNEHSDLEGFLKGGHYSSCKCDQGTVLCKVPHNRSYAHSAT